MMNFIIRNKERGIALLFWLAVWQIVTMFLGQEILLVSPFRVLCQTIQNMTEITFYYALFSTMVKISAGFFIGAALGFALAFFSHFFVFVKAMLSPFVRFLKTVPVVSFIILALVFFNSFLLPLVISATVVFPLVYIQVEKGLEQIDGALLEMAEVFHISLWNRLKYIYLEGIKGVVFSSLEIGMGMAWKSGLAAEVIALPKWGIGTNLYNAKIYLDMANLFSYTFVGIVSALCLEKVLQNLLRRKL